MRSFTDLIIFTDIHINALSIYADILLKVSWKENIIITQSASCQFSLFFHKSAVYTNEWCAIWTFIVLNSHS